MEDRNKDLPLIVSEILIEMHEMKDEIHGMSERLTGVEKAVNRMAELMLVQQQETNRKLDLMLEGNKSNTQMLIEAFSREATTTHSRLDDHESRIGKLENK
jgi:hypothetical protein